MQKIIPSEFFRCDWVDLTFNSQTCRYTMVVRHGEDFCTVECDHCVPDEHLKDIAVTHKLALINRARIATAVKDRLTS